MNARGSTVVSATSRPDWVFTTVGQGGGSSQHQLPALPPPSDPSEESRALEKMTPEDAMGLVTSSALGKGAF